MLVELIMGAIVKEGFSAGIKHGKGILAKREARQELAQICAAAIEAAIPKASALAEDLRSESFVKQVIIPALQSSLSDPSRLPDPKALANDFVNMFVRQFTKNDCENETLRSLFQSSRPELLLFFEAFLDSLRSALWQSKHWREVAHEQTSSEALNNTRSILRLLEGQAHDRKLDDINIDDARLQARQGSSELRQWPTDIFGAKIPRSALESMSNLIRNNPCGTTLLIGEAGSGKSALMADLTALLEDAGKAVFALKADMLSETVTTLQAIEDELGLTKSIVDQITALSRNEPVVLLIDQLDAVSDVMDRSSARMRLLIKLVRDIRARKDIDQKHLNVHVVVSSRPFEAKHDARFQQLKADDEVSLQLPRWDAVSELLKEIDIDPDSVDAALRETLRRPFALKLYAEIVKRGADVAGLQASHLLDQWLLSADLGNEDERKHCVALMTILAEEMLETESLWRPKDRFEMEYRDTVRRCVACGLLVESGMNIGFSHQSWLDDFQAKSFKTGADLAEYAWTNQNSLFVRATLLRGLQRLRLVDPDRYLAAIDALLQNDNTRRHVRHLVIDVISINPIPLPREVTWLEYLVNSDDILARRGLAKSVDHWEGWREKLRKIIPGLMKQEKYEWQATALLAAEARFDPSFVVSCLDQNWSDQKYDAATIRVLEQSGIVTEDVKQRLQDIYAQGNVDEYGISGYVTKLVSDERYEDAAAILEIWLPSQKIERYTNPKLYRLNKFSEASPQHVSRVLMPWFAKLITDTDTSDRSLRGHFERTDALPMGWDRQRDDDDIFGVLRTALAAWTKADPLEAWKLLEPYANILVDEMQDVIAETLAAAGPALAQQSLDFLNADKRRLSIGNASVVLRGGVYSSVPGLVSLELVKAISPHLSDEQNEILRDYIEDWDCYDSDAFAGAEPETQKMRLRWADQRRMALLQCLPGKFLTPRRRRQIKEWRAREPKPLRRDKRLSMASWVGSPMTHEEMGKASDDAIMGMLDKINDQSGERDHFRRPSSRNGGVVEVSRAFAAFGEAHPERAIRIARERLQLGIHEQTAGTMVEKLAGTDDVKLARTLLDLIAELSEKGFSSSEWHHWAASALQKLAGTLEGLPQATLELLESWLECDPEAIKVQIQERIAFEERNAKNNKSDENSPIEPIMFGNHLGGMRILPHDNFTILSAIYNGLLAGDTPDNDGWLDVLARHVDRPEDPAIWTAIVNFNFHALFWADRKNTHTFIRRLWTLDREIFADIEVVHAIWPIKAIIPEQLMIKMITQWHASEDQIDVQGAAEFITACHLNDPDNPAYAELFEKLKPVPSIESIGKIFMAAAAWREEDAGLREPAHVILSPYFLSAAGDIAIAVSKAASFIKSLQPDQFTREFLAALCKNDELIAETLGYSFFESLQSLLIHPGFDADVLNVIEKAALLKIGDNSGFGGHRGEDLVQIAVALMRNDNGLRIRAMDVYESLLDANVYGAEEAAQTAVGR